MNKLYTLGFYKKHITNPCSDKNNILFGTYDNIKFSSIKTYSEAEKMISISQYNVLDGQLHENIEPDYPTSMIVLYSLEEGLKNSELWESGFELGRKLDFLSVILFSSQEYKGNLFLLSNKIHDKVTNDEDIKISCFGTFGMYDMCVVVRAVSIEKVIEFVDSLYENEEIKSIKTSYTIVNYIGDSTERRLITEDKKDCIYIANIQITCACKKARRNILSKLDEYLGKDYEKIVSYAVLGEYDMCVHIPANILPLKLYQQDGMFNSYSKFYKDNIIQCCTRISKKETIDDFGKSFEEDDSTCSNENTIEVRDLHNKIIERIRKLTHDKELNDFALNRILQLAYVDFCKAYFIAPQSKTIIDLECQFISTIDCISQVLNREKDVGYDKVYDAVSELAEMLSKKIYIVNQENSYAIVEPYSYLYNTGILQDIIHMYESFIKSFIAVIYANGSTMQSELIPVVLVDAAANFPISNLFIYNENKNESNGKEQNCDQLRIISIKFPLDIILCPEMYLPLLVHEIVHYLCPYNRILRNKIVLNLYMKLYFCSMLKALVNRDEIIYFDNVFIDFISLWFEKNFDSIINRFEFSNNPVLDFESKSLTFSSQIENLFDTSFSKYCEDSSINSEFFKVFKQCVSDFQEEYKISIFNDSDNLQHQIVSYGKNKTYISHIKDFSDGLKELICDMFMCEFFGLDEVSYFSLIVISILNQNLKQKINHGNLVSVIIRFGGIIKWEFKHEEKTFDINKYSKEIITMVGNINPIYKSRENDIKEILEMLGNSILQFFKRYYSYIAEISDYIKCYNIESYCGGLEFYNYEFKINTMVKKFGDSLKEVHNCFEKFKTNFTGEKDYTLENAVKLIQLLPNEITLKDLSSFYKECQNFKCKNPIKMDCGFNEKKITIYKNKSGFDDATNIYIDKNGIESAIKLAKRNLIDDDTPNDSLWYRGQVNASWGVAPALFRNCSNNNFRDKLIDAYELFRAQACESLEIHTNIDSDSDWIACMQHYFVPTHFLDWSEQPLTSLYFALENYFDYPCKYFKQPIPECDFEKMRSQCSSDSALFVLNPNRMNRILSGLNGVPNISIQRNELLYKNYVLPNRGDRGAVEMKTSKDFFSQPSSENNCWKYMPMAVITSQLNSRIKAQKGHFVAYNLQVNYSISPEEEDKKKEVYKATSVCDLYAIQKELYRICCEKGKKFKPFIAKIIIPNSDKEEVYSTLKAYGINKSSFYPELMHIGTDVSKIVF